MSIAGTALHALGAQEALALFRTRALSPVELMEAVLARAEAVEPTVNALPFTHPEHALAQARAAEARYAGGGDGTRPLDGLPVAVKEEAPIEGLPNTYGSLVHAEVVATETAPFVERILAAGGIVHAQTATPEYSCTATTHSRLWGATRNPWDPSRAVGGSSGGSAAALASGTAPLATGSDIGGSIRIPSAYCGTVGFKPPPGRVPEMAPFNRDYYCHEGPMARSVADVALMQNVISGPHHTDVASLRPKLWIPGTPESIAGWKVAVCVTLGDYAVDADWAANTLAVADALRAAGADVQEVELPWTAEQIGHAALCHLGTTMGAGIGALLDEHRDQLNDYTIALAERGRALPREALLEGMAIEGGLYPALGRLLEDHRALICPTMAVGSWEAGVTVPLDQMTREAMTLPFNMFSNCPVMAMPSGFAADGLPTGVQVVGPTFDDVSVFAVAAAIERERPWPRLAPDGARA
ncbi:amidase [Baekduia sp. Peel2402]|uniref:amidase n=1 Tax=Baekduia sp. Peel2402 TaxID=3458296 RepID=UPI00403EDE94